MNLDEFQRRMGQAPAALERAHLEAAQRAGGAVVVAWNARAGSTVRPGAPLPRSSGKGWPGAQVKTVGGKRPSVLVGLSNPAQLVFGPTRTEKHVIGGKGLGTRGAIAKKVAAPGPAKFSTRRKGARGIRFPNGGVRTYVTHPGSRRRNIKPDLNESAQAVIPPVFSKANVSTLRAIGLGH